MTSFRELAEREAQTAGFDLCGVSPVDALPELSYFPEWIAAGKAGEMRYLEARNEAGELKRADLRSAAPWARSVIVCAINYNTAQPYSTDAAPAGSGWISRYAWFENADYHDAILRRLRDVEARIASAWSEPIRTWCYVDTGPVVERVYAKYAGLGWIAKNTCVINEEKGSWLFLGVILTSVALEPGEYPLPAADRCGSCTRCIEACPTNAIVEPYKLDPRLCISYLTIEKRGEIPNELRSGIGRNIFGCDICQDVCPWNGGVAEPKRPAATTLPEFAVRDELVNPNLERLARMSRDQFQQLFRGSPIKRAKYEGLKRNVAIAMGNSGRAEFLPVLEELAADDSPVVAEHARWSIDQLTRNQVVKSSH